jgi:eukaryotic-like serine/threonine-protein kinase
MLTKIGKFVVQSEIGRGGFGRVYRAYDPVVGRLVAVKVLTEGTADLLTRFRNEANVAANLRHDNIVTIYDYGEHEGKPFLAMEYLEGKDLLQIIAAKKPLSLLEKCKIMLQVAEGLDYAHRSGVIHRDIKPANIMVLAGGRVKIMDFGIARLTKDPDVTRLTQEGSMIGTLRYMAPELFSGSDATILTDVFAYGITFYELLASTHPFPAADAGALMFKLTTGEAPPLRDFISDCPETLQRIVNRLLHKDPELRFPNLRAVQIEIEPLRIELQMENAAELLIQAQTACANQQWQQAQSLVSDVLNVEPSNHVARSLWEDLQKRLQLRAIQPRIESLLKSGDEDLVQRRFSEAVASFEAALRLDKHDIRFLDRRS